MSLHVHVYYKGTIRELTNAKVGVDTGISCSACEVFVLTIRDMLVCAGISVLFCQTKVYDVHHIALLSKTHQKVVWFHVSVDEVF